MKLNDENCLLFTGIFALKWTSKWTWMTVVLTMCLVFNMACNSRATEMERNCPWLDEDTIGSIGLKDKRDHESCSVRFRLSLR